MEAQHVLVVDGAAVSAFTTMDGEQMRPSRRLDDRFGCEIGSYVVLARRTGSWDAIVALMLFLDAKIMTISAG